MMKTQTDQLLEDFLARSPKKHKAIWEEVSEEMDFALLLKETRLNAKISQKHLAEKSGISQPEISKIENAVISPTLKTVEKYLHSLGKQLIITDIE